MISNKEDYISRLNQYINELSDELEELTKEERSLNKRQDSLIKMNGHNKKRIKELDNEIYKLTASCNGYQKNIAIAIAAATVIAGTVVSFVGVHEIVTALEISSAFETSVGIGLLPMFGLGAGAKVMLDKREEYFSKRRIEPLNVERNELERSFDRNSKKIHSIDKELTQVIERKHEVEGELKTSSQDLAATLRKPNNKKFRIDQIYIPDEIEYEDRDVAKYADAPRKR